GIEFRSYSNGASSLPCPTQRCLTLAEMRPIVFFVVLAAVTVSAQPRELRWAADPEGGAPYVEADPADPSRVEGFEVDIADLIARSLGRTPRFTFMAYASIDQSVARGDADLGLNGLEDTP